MSSSDINSYTSFLFGLRRTIAANGWKLSKYMPRSPRIAASFSIEPSPWLRSSTTRSVISAATADTSMAMASNTTRPTLPFHPAHGVAPRRQNTQPASARNAASIRFLGWLTTIP